MRILRTPPVESKNSITWRRPPSIRPKVATTEATPSTMPTSCSRLRVRWLLMSTTPSTTDSQSEDRCFRIGRTGSLGLEAVVDDAPVDDLDHALALVGDARVVGHDHDRLALLVHAVQDPLDLEPGLAVQVAGRLVR